MNVPGVAVRGRGALPTLALTLALTLGGCGHAVSQPGPQWQKVGQADRQGYIIWRDLAGCYWVDGSEGIGALKSGDHQWCEAARSASPQGNSGNTPDQDQRP